MPGCNTATHKHSQRVLCRQCSYTTNATKQRAGLCRRFPDHLPHFAAVVWRVHPAILYLLRHTGAYHSAATPPAHTRYHRHAGRRTGQHSCPIIIRYIRGQTMPAAAGQLLPCAGRWQVLTRCQQYRPGAPAKECSVSTCTGSARRLAIWNRSAVRAHPLPGGAVQRQGHGWRRGTIDGYRRISFRAFAR